MAPKQQLAMKRAALKKDPAQPPAKKVKLPSNVQTLCDLVASAKLPESCRDMLLSCLPQSFMTAAGERQQLQALIVGFVGEIVESTGDSISGRIVETRARIAELKAQEKSFEDAVSEAEQSKNASDDALKAKIASSDSAQGEVETTNLDLTAATDACRSCQEVLSALQGEQVFLTATVPQIVSGEEPLPTEDEVISKIQPLAKLVELDKSLMSALPSACAKAKANRGAFDNMVIEQLKKALEEKSKEMESKVAMALKQHSEKEKLVEAAHMSATEAAERSQAASREVDAARQRLHDSDASLVAARDELKMLIPTLMDASKELDQCEVELKHFADHTQACFHELRGNEPQAGSVMAAAPGEAEDSENVAANEANACLPSQKVVANDCMDNAADGFASTAGGA